MRRVAVDDFERVKEGDLLVEIEDDDYRARAAQAEADLLGAKAAIENLKARKAAQHAQVAEAEDAIKATQADVERTRLEAARQRTLLSGRGAGYPTPPPQIPACSFPAPGSRRRSNAIVGFGRHRSAGSLLL